MGEKKPTKKPAKPKPGGESARPARATETSAPPGAPPPPDHLTAEPASELISARIREMGDWRGETLARVRELIKGADPEIVEEWKWGTPVWSHGGLICTGETYKSVVKLTFSKGASLKDPSRLFNSSLDGNVRRAIDIREHDKIDEGALKRLIQEAVALNLEGKGKRPVSTKLISEPATTRPRSRDTMAGEASEKAAKVAKKAAARPAAPNSAGPVARRGETRREKTQGGGRQG